ncbi:hypothetical protein A2480_04500 [Candidatus Uhrbacteria bacterium RIFOXYC2_FULL_47_19]|uniref:Aspartyl/glutamyl-tRNA(Asn/Gln) amidotransferase subunit C n=1 Tax=Candidatus Uhrbacteria bacterium RIFOXYC2_FULL_47_19 TaxID=1802424 RepID=A0A1F7WCL5_9BACT|nr:MAG: hypothetical protein A2480_04500 [Candidatus Uhrbacteria bacterium RIFOXYC2_FULL_47_19]HCC21771.1 Asp-tRNA(Asn)/Glu-tRNA(Gln) amidotransferase GatCAB subunit C [Candidatus Uhrbacteria bacterium]
MSLSQAEVEKIAELSRLKLFDDECDSFRVQLSSILDYVSQLSEVDISEVEPMSHSVPLINVLRNDVAADCPDNVRQAMIDAFPESDENLLKVKAVFS